MGSRGWTEKQDTACKGRDLAITITNARRWARSSAVTAAVLLWGIAVTLCVAAYAPVAKDGADVACILQEPNDIWASPAHSPESVSAQGTWSFLPFGLECQYTATDTNETVLVPPSLLPSAAVGAAILISVAAIACAVVYFSNHSPR